MRSLRTVTLLTATAALVGSALVTTSMASATPVRASASVVPAVVAASGQFTSVGPTRILDTRTTHHPFAGGVPENLQITGKGGVPATGVSSVVFNLTVTGGTATRAYVTAYPRGTTRPTASNINFARGWTGANLVTVKLGTSGQITLYASAGHVNLLIDVVGWYSDGNVNPPGTTGQFQEVQATRLVDTRNTGSIDGRGTLTDPMTFTLNSVVANPHVKAVAVNLTVVHPKDSGFLTAWSGVGNPPTTSVLNFPVGKTVANLAVVPVSPCTLCTGASHNLPSITVLNGSDAPTDLLIDIWGFYDDGQLGSGLYYKALPAPVRIVDTRSGLGATTLTTGITRTVSNTGSVAGLNTQMLVQNVTALPQTNTYVTLWKTGDPRPTVSNLDPLAGATVATLALTAVDTSNRFNIYNNSFTTNVLVDVAGSFESVAPAPAVAQNAARSTATRPAVEKWSVASGPLTQH